VVRWVWEGSYRAQGPEKETWIKNKEKIRNSKILGRGDKEERQPLDMTGGMRGEAVFIGKRRDKMEG